MTQGTCAWDMVMGAHVEVYSFAVLVQMNPRHILQELT